MLSSNLFSRLDLAVLQDSLTAKRICIVLRFLCIH